eukprot:8770110-Karenia_brevis.AAC.1
MPAPHHHHMDQKFMGVKEGGNSFPDQRPRFPTRDLVPRPDTLFLMKICRCLEGFMWWLAC